MNSKNKPDIAREVAIARHIWFACLAVLFPAMFLAIYLTAHEHILWAIVMSVTVVVTSFVVIGGRPPEFKKWS